MRAPPPVSDGNEAVVEAALRTEEKETIRQLAAPRAIVVHEVIREEGEDELRRTNSMLFWSGLAAGLSMGFSLVAQGLIQAHLPNATWRPLVVSLGYSVGYLIVILGRQQLFTENTLTVILPLLTRRDRRTFLGVARLWAIVLVANLVGAAIFVWVISHTSVFHPDVQRAFGEISRATLGEESWSIFIRGIFAGWLIALMVWILPSAESQKALIIIVITFVVGLGQFSHIVAGSTEVLYMVMTNGATFGQFLAYALPTFLGNAVGGVTLVAALNHAQVTSGIASTVLSDDAESGAGRPGGKHDDGQGDRFRSERQVSDRR